MTFDIDEPRHLPFTFASIERDQRMTCMTHTIIETGIEAGLRERLARSFFQTADFMRNTEGLGAKLVHWCGPWA